MKSVELIILVNILVLLGISNASVELKTNNGGPIFDEDLYQNVLDPELCKAQLEETRKNMLLWLQFIESGIRIPRGITLGNFADLGNYHQCLGINEDINNTIIKGKYCSINVPVNQKLNLPDFPPSSGDWPNIELPDWIDLPDGVHLPDWITNPRHLEFEISDEILNRLRNSEPEKFIALPQINRVTRSGILGDLNLALRLAICVPTACTVREGFDGLLFNTTALEFQFEEISCRLPNDKPWVPGDYVAIAIFSFIGLLTIFSTSYDIYQCLVLKSDPKSISTLYRSFSVYTNGRRLTTFNKIPGALECLDGIRSIAMIWVLLGHTFLSLPPFMNSQDVFKWMFSHSSFYITSAPITVDTFFMMSGLLLVYTTANKLTGVKLLKSLHFFYLNRLLRMFPLLAATILLQASLLHHISDGANWPAITSSIKTCRKNWWITLLYLQNFINNDQVCLGHSWYLAIDMQLYIISPIVLFFVLGRKKNVAWSSLLIALLVILASSATYIFLMSLNGAIVSNNIDFNEMLRYNRYYYMNPLARASPFFVGMLFGYFLHTFRENKLRISTQTNIILWICAFGLTSLGVYSSEPMKAEGWDNRAVDGLVNTFSRPGWALGLGWIITACVQGYGGPINWFLSLEMWKLPARISYAMYLLHFPIMFAIQGTAIAPIYFTQAYAFYEFCARFLLSFVVGFFATLLIDSPFSTLFKLLIGGGQKQPEQKKVIEKTAQIEIEKL